MGLAYSVCSMNVFSSYWGFFSIYAGVAHEKAKDTIEAIKYELQQIKEKGVTEEELAMAKEQVKSSYIFGLENINSRMFSIGKNQLLLNKVFTAEEVLGGFDAVTGDDILKAAEIIGDCSAYCGASVTGKDFDLEGNDETMKIKVKTMSGVLPVYETEGAAREWIYGRILMSLWT